MEGGDVEIHTKTLQVEHKLFYFDLKENPRGRYLKISEKTTTSRSTIIVPDMGIAWFVDIFNHFVNNVDNPGSRDLPMDGKIFHFDTGANPRGRFLKVSEVSAASVRSTIIVPAGNGADEGWVQFRDVLRHMIQISMENRVPSQAAAAQVNPSPEHLPSTSFFEDGAVTNGGSRASITTNDAGRSRVLRVEQKKFFFDLNTNARGQYLRISEVTGGDRSAIILPASGIEQFHEMIGQFVKTLKAQEAPEMEYSK